MIVFRIKLKDGSYLGLNNNAISSKDMFYKTTKDKARKYYTEINAGIGARMARKEQYLAEQAYFATIEQESV